MHPHERATLLRPCAQLDEDTLSDLSYAFMAIDLDHSGTLEADELLQLLRVVGDDDTIELEECRQLISNAKVSLGCLARPQQHSRALTQCLLGVVYQSDFKQWRQAKKLTDYLPDEYQYPGSDESDECVLPRCTVLAGL